MAAQTLILPAGTNLTSHLNLPTCGNWMGLVRVSLSTTLADATIHSWLFVYPNHADGKIRFRRTGGTSGGNYQNWTLSKDRRVIRWLYQFETMTTINYTSTNPISVCVETTRTVTPAAFPPVPATAYPTELAAPGDTLNGKVYWKAS